MTEGDKNVYAVLAKYGNHFGYTEDDLRDRTLVDFPLTDLDYIRLSRIGQQTIELNRVFPEGTVAVRTWMMRKPYSFLRETDTEALTVFLKKIVLDKLVDFIDDDPDDFTMYGLSPPQAELELRAGEESVILFVGKQVGESINEYYVQQSGSSAVITVESQKLRFLDVEPFDLIEKTIFPINISTIESIAVFVEGVGYDLQVEQLNESGQSRFSVNDVEVGEKAFMNFYVRLTGIPLVGEVEIEPAAEFELIGSIKFRVKSIAGENADLVTMEFFSYNSRYLLLVIGDNIFLVPRDQVEQMIESLYTLTGE